jgi:hypothetical protein
MAQREYYFGGNNTRASIVQNPAAWTGANPHIFGVKEFRKHGFASDAVKDAAAEREISKGYSKKRNPVCPSCFVQMPATKVCGTCE